MEPVIRNVEGQRNPVLGPDQGVPNYVMLYVQHAPGASSPDYTHPWEHQAFIVEGSGVLWCDGNEYPVRQGDAVLVPPDTRHYFTNTGDVTLSRVTVNPLSSVGGH
jgi:quercetin dioxygenase-like cupin family protein